jgi:hypothetical protein
MNLNKMTDKENTNELMDLTESFSVTKLEILTGTITKKEENNSYTIILPVAKFILDGQITDTTLWFDNVLLSGPLAVFIGKTVTFPVNPAEGYIDGSTYLRGAHNPVDITAIKFIKIENKTLVAELTMDFVFEFEGIGFKNERMIKEVVLIIK